jgi:nucleoside-diphosphate-sugar epimerase
MAAVLVTGANGVTGSYVVERILSGTEFARCVGTSRRPPNADWVKKDLPVGVLGGKLTWATADLYVLK